MVCMTHRWRKTDSNCRSRGTRSWFQGRFVSLLPDIRSNGKVAAHTGSWLRIHLSPAASRTNFRLSEGGDDPADADLRRSHGRVNSAAWQGRYDRMSKDYLKLTGETPTSMANFVKLRFSLHSEVAQAGRADPAVKRLLTITGVNLIGFATACDLNTPTSNPPSSFKRSMRVENPEILAQPIELAQVSVRWPQTRRR